MRASKSAEKIGFKSALDTKQEGRGLKASKSMTNMNMKRNSSAIGIGSKAARGGEKGVVGLTPEEKYAKWIKGLPQQVRHLAHLDCIKDPLVSDKQKLEYYKKFNIESKEKEWTYPKTE
jgi:hypothetical protein